MRAVATVTPYEELGEILRAARVRRILEQKKLGELLGVSDRSVRDWERGHSRPSLHRIPELALELELDAVVEELRGRDQSAVLAKLSEHEAGARERSHELTGVLCEIRDRLPQPTIGGST